MACSFLQPLALEVIEDDGRDEIAADDEKDIDADETSAKKLESGMEENDGDHRQGS
jgi:hypothetical protein